MRTTRCPDWCIYQHAPGALPRDHISEPTTVGDWQVRADVTIRRQTRYAHVTAYSGTYGAVAFTASEARMVATLTPDDLVRVFRTYVAARPYTPPLEVDPDTADRLGLALGVLADVAEEWQ